MHVTCSSLFAIASALSIPVQDDTFELHAFERQELSDVYFSEGVGTGDLDGDGAVDVVCGPYWYAGPSFSERHELYAPVAQDRNRYSDNFFSWVYDIDGDGQRDVFVVGFPGTPAHVYRNPGPDRRDGHWTKHAVIDQVSNESPWFIDLTGDGRPELVCTHEGAFGYATIDQAEPLGTWAFHRISDASAPARFGHGLGVGDIDGDGRLDVIHAHGWFEQPDELGDAPWTSHKVAFTNSYGGAEMHAYDVDGDGDSDVITSLAAHDFGLAWYEQVQEDGARAFRKHLIVGHHPSQSPYGLVFSEPHSVALVDVDGDGLKDIVSGKTYWSHHEKSPMWDAGAVVYWFRLVRERGDVDWVPHLVDGEAGIGRQVRVGDVDQDGLVDVVVGGMKGAHVLRHRTRRVNEVTWRAAQPPRVFDSAVGRVDRGPTSKIDPDSGFVAGALEGETLEVLRVSAGDVRVQKMTGFPADRWSGGGQLFWTGAKPRARLELKLEVETAGTYEVSAVFTVAKDYGIVNVLLDSVALGSQVDLFEYPDVRTTGLLKLDTRVLSAGEHVLTIELIGANEAAAPGHMVGLDYVLLTREPPF